MPTLKEHCKSCEERYGYSFEIVHKWIDEPVKIATGHHRSMRHNYKTTPKEAEKVFWDLVPYEYRTFIKHAVIDHLILDKETERDKKKKHPEVVYLPLDKPKNLKFVVFHLEKMRILCRRVEHDLEKKDSNPRLIVHKFASFILDHTRNSIKHYPPTEKVEWVKEIYKIMKEFEVVLWKINTKYRNKKDILDSKIKHELLKVKDSVESIIDEEYYKIEVTKEHEKASLRALEEMNSVDRIFTSAKDLIKK